MSLGPVPAFNGREQNRRLLEVKTYFNYHRQAIANQSTSDSREGERIADSGHSFTTGAYLIHRVG